MSEQLAELAGTLFDAKRREDAAKKERIAIEEQIAALVETPTNGSKTVEAGDSGLKITVRKGLSYTANLAAITAMVAEGQLPEDVSPLSVTDPVPSQLVFDVKKYETLREKNPELFNLVGMHIITKPKKSSVSVKMA